MRAVPAVGPQEVRVRLEGCGVCGSNLPVWEGRPWFNYPFAAGAPGHEGWGFVDAVGQEVQSVKAGDRVAVLSYNAFAEYDVATADRVVPLPPALNGQPFPGEALGCAYNVFQRSDIQRQHTVAIVGLGFMGALLTNLAAKAGARVIGISRRPFALEIARRMGAVETVPLTDNASVIGAVRELTGGAGCERVIEATGLQGPLDLAGELTAERGRLVIAGYHQDGMRQVNMQLWNWRGLDVTNAHERDPRAYVAGIRAAIDAIFFGLMDPSPLYTDRFRLEHLPQAFGRMHDRDGQFLKALLSYD
jgi:threonine dehydrogenase-like Zn-dependent dehydrogenase